MIAQMYKRRERMAWIFLSGTLLVVGLWGYFQFPETSREWLDFSVFLLPISFCVAVILVSRFQYKKVKDISVPLFTETLQSINHIVIKKDVAFLPRLFLFQKNGQFIGTVKPYEIPLWKTVLLVLNRSFISILPLRFGILHHNGQLLGLYEKKGWIRRVHMMIFNQERQPIGQYIQHEWKHLLHVRGELFTEQDELLLEIAASGFLGDFKWLDAEGKQIAYFYNGKFPHEYTHLFRDSHNDIVELSPDLSVENKIRLISVISFLFMNRFEK